VAVESIRDWLTSLYQNSARLAEQGTVLWLAHTEELCEQACAASGSVGSIRNVCPLHLFRFWGRHTQDLSHHANALPCSSRSPASWSQRPAAGQPAGWPDRGSEAVLRDFRSSLGLLLIDEAHR
jgi:hypothetical protein